MKSRLYLTLFALGLAACTVGPDFQSPNLSGGTKWKGGQATAGAHLPDAWWRLYNDRELTRLVDRSLAANNDLAAAKARVNTSRVLVGVDRARLFPTLNLNGKAGVSRSSEGVATNNIPPGLPIDLDNQRYSGSFDLAYDPDLWGANKRRLESVTAQSAATEAQYDSLRLGVATEVVRQYFVLRGLDAQEIVLNNTIKARKSELEIQQSKANAGLIDGLAPSRARTELELANADLAAVQRQRGSAEHALAVLCGSRPNEFSITARESTGVLPSLRAGLPAEVLNRRPDVRAAEQSLRAANAEIGVAEAAFYPSFNLLAGAGLESLDTKSFLNWQNRVLSLGAGVTAPIFTGGSNKAKFDAAVSRRDEALANYRNVLLVALREVEDAFVDLKGLARSEAALEQALASAKDTKRLSTERYDRGLTSYLEIVDAERTVLRTQLVLCQNEAQQRIAFAALAKALGGGWSGK